MKNYVLVLLCLILTGILPCCSNSTVKSNTENSNKHNIDSDSIPKADSTDQIFPVKITLSQIQSLKSYSIQTVSEVLNLQGFSIDSSDIKDIVLDKTNIEINDYDKCDIYKISLKETVSESEKGDFFEVVNESNSEATFFNVNKLMLFNFDISKGNYIVGVRITRHKGYLLAFDFYKGKFITKLNTLDSNCSSGFPVVLVNTDCVSYNNDSLSILNTDLNGDGILDINLKGVLNIYCEGLELGKSKDDGNKPYRSIPINIKYISQYKNQQIEWNTIGVSKNICEILNKY